MALLTFMSARHTARGKLFDAVRYVMCHSQEQVMRDDNHALVFARIGDRNCRILQQMPACFCERVAVCAANDDVRIPLDELLATDLAKARDTLVSRDVDDAKRLQHIIEQCVPAPPWCLLVRKTSRAEACGLWEGWLNLCQVMLHILDQGVGVCVFTYGITDGTNVGLDIIKAVEVRETQHGRVCRLQELDQFGFAVTRHKNDIRREGQHLLSIGGDAFFDQLCLCGDVAVVRIVSECAQSHMRCGAHNASKISSVPSVCETMRWGLCGITRGVPLASLMRRGKGALARSKRRRHVGAQWLHRPAIGPERFNQHNGYSDPTPKTQEKSQGPHQPAMTSMHMSTAHQSL